MNYIKKILDRCPSCDEMNSSRQEVCGKCGCSLVESVIDVVSLEARVGKIENQLQKLVKDSESWGKSAKGVVSLEARFSNIESQLQKLVKDSESWGKSAKDMVSLEGRRKYIYLTSSSQQIILPKFYLLKNDENHYRISISGFFAVYK